MLQVRWALGLLVHMAVQPPEHHPKILQETINGNEVTPLVGEVLAEVYSTASSDRGVWGLRFLFSFESIIYSLRPESV